MAKTNAERCRTYYAKNRTTRIASTKAWRARNPTKWKDYDAERTKRFRDAVFAYYGPVCKCCGETILEFLTIDHINNDGNVHRRSGVTSIYQWLVKHQFPPGFQVLCMNCNFAKSIKGGCPHQRPS